MAMPGLQSPHVFIPLCLSFSLILMVFHILGQYPTTELFFSPYYTSNAICTFLRFYGNNIPKEIYPFLPTPIYSHYHYSQN